MRHHVGIEALDELPQVDQRRVAVRVTPDALRQVRGGHPWIFDRAVTSVSHEADVGALAVLFDADRRFAAVGLWDPASPIRVRVLHEGSPRTVDDEFWTDRLIDAFDRRKELLDDPDTTAHRCVHGENDGFPGLVIDRYGDVAVVKAYTAAWLPHLRSIVPLFADLAGVGTVVLRLGRTVTVANPPVVLVGPPPTGAVRFLEHGLHFEADVLAGQKTGHFLDQRDNRGLVRGLAAGARVLDVFCCTGGFSVHAAAGGARSVDSVDRSVPALDATDRNMAANREAGTVATVPHRTIEGDAFEVMAELVRTGHRYDLVVVDPPSFASRAGQVEGALRAYQRLTLLAADLVDPGGMLVQSSCSSRVTEDVFHDQVTTTLRGTGRRVEEWARTGHAVDHPVGFPEGRYLKTHFARLDT